MPPHFLDLVRRHNGKLAVGAALILFLGAAVVHGLWTDRWDDGKELATALARLDRLPMTAGSWLGTETSLEPEQEDQAARAGIGRVRQIQFNQGPNTPGVGVILMGGRFGPLSVHTPDVCYGSAGYSMVGKPYPVVVTYDNGATATFWSAQFQKPPSQGAPALRIFWGWNAGAGWQAPTNPRWTFRRKPVLFKLYVAREVLDPNEVVKIDPGVAFLQQWLPELDRTLFP